jgi:signal transduction histidine kinase
VTRIRGTLAHVGRGLWAMPAWAPVQPVRLRRLLVAAVVGIWVLAGLVAGLMPWSGDWIAALVAAILVAAMAAYAIPVFGGVQGRWSASGFFHLAFSYAIGPPAILAMAIGQSGGSALRRHPGPFRTSFNVSNHFLADAAAWFVFQHLSLGGDSTVIALALRGAAGACAESIVNRALLFAVVALADEPIEVSSWLKSLAAQASIASLFGVTAAGATLLYHWEGTFGIVTLLLPLAMVQSSLVALARRSHEHAIAQERQMREREDLLRREARASQRAADASRRATEASERERRKLAADLHDGVIQDVGGLSIVLAATESRLGEEHGDLRRLIQESIDTSRRINRDLRSMVIELAPPELEKHGLREALSELLRRLERQGITAHLECEELDVDPARLRLAHRVVQEAMRNAIKHSGCRNLWVTVRYEGVALVATVRDDGRGFSAEDRIARQQRDHNGLGLLEQTALDGGGVLTVTSEPGLGTTVELYALPADDSGAPPTGPPAAGAGTVPVQPSTPAPPARRTVKRAPRPAARPQRA